MTAIETFANQPQTTVSSGGTTAPSPGATETWLVASSASFPSASTGTSQFHVTDVASGKTGEIVAVTNVSGTTWSVTRGAESTTPVAHTAGFTIVQSVTAGALGGMLQAGNNLSDVAARQTAMDNLAGAVTSGDYLRGNGTHVVMGTIAAGDVPGVNGVTVSGTPSAGQVLTATGSSAADWAAPAGGSQPWQFQPESYGAKGDGKIVADGAMTSGSGTLTCSTSAPFVSGDVGKVITVEGAGSTLTGTSAHSALVTTISGYTSSSVVTLTATAGATVSGRTVTYGTDDTSAVNSAVTAAASYATANRYYAEIIFAPSIYIIAGALIQGGASKTNSQIPLPVVPITGNPAMTLALIGTRNNSGPEMFQGSGDTPAAASNGTVLASTLTGQAYSGTYGQPAVIGGPTSEQGYTGGFTNLWNNLAVVIDGLTILVPPVVSVSGADLTSCTQAEVKWLRCLAAAPAYTLAGGTYNPVWTGSQSFPKGLSMPQGGNNAHCLIGSFTCYGFATGAQLWEHSTFTEITAILCGNGIVPNGAAAGHNVTGLRYCCEANNTHILIAAGNPIGLNIVSMQAENVSQWTSGHHVDDASNHAHGRIGINTSQTVASINVNGGANLEIILDYASGSAGQQARGVVGPPTVPATTVALANPYWRHAEVYLTSGGAAVTAIAVNGTATGLTLGTSGSVTVRVPSGGTITLTYASTAPTWVWVLD